MKARIYIQAAESEWGYETVDKPVTIRKQKEHKISDIKSFTKFKRERTIKDSNSRTKHKGDNE